MTYTYMGPSSSSSIIETPAVPSVYKVRLPEITQNKQGGIAVDSSSRGMLRVSLQSVRELCEGLRRWSQMFICPSIITVWTKTLWHY